jgi:hypothetical protein
MVNMMNVLMMLEVSLAKAQDEQRERLAECSQDKDYEEFQYTGGYEPDQGNCHDTFQLGVQYGEELGRLNTLEHIIKTIKGMKE